MAINLVVAVTDFDWFRMLSQQSELTEVNFWSPTGRNFRALREGELFLFKLHAPHNMIVGGGIFAHANVLPCSLAWEAFGQANGAPSEEEMRRRIAKYRSSSLSEGTDFRIGCRVLTQPFFLDESDWIATPKSWSRNIVAYKTYDASEGDGLDLWRAVYDRLHAQKVHGVADTGPKYGRPQLIKPRLGQGGFRVVVTDVYRQRCAVTQERTLPALDAAHIRPYGTGGAHEARNGLLLRRDIHKLFDDGYVTVTPQYNFEVSRSIREEYENGRDYYAMHGTKILLPSRSEQRPDHEALIWHSENVYKG